MRPQHQTIFGSGENGSEPGNCFATCIAMLLNLDVSEVPNFCAEDNWRKAVNEWLSNFGLFYLDVALPGDGRDDVFFEAVGWHVISGPGPRGLRHSVIGWGGQALHDPHPSGAGLLAHEEYGLLVPRDPS